MWESVGRLILYAKECERVEVLEWAGPISLHCLVYRRCCLKIQNTFIFYNKELFDLGCIYVYKNTFWLNIQCGCFEDRWKIEPLN